MNEEYKFLLEDEKVIRELEKGFYCIRYGSKLDHTKTMINIEESLRKPVLTNKRLILFKEEIKFPFHKLLGKIDYKIPVETIESVEPDISGSNPYLRMLLKDGDVVSLLFFGAPDFEPVMKFKSIVDQWVLSINNLILLRKFFASSSKFV